MKQSPIRVNARTLGDLLSLKEQGLVGGLKAKCFEGACGRGSAHLDLDRLAREHGADYPWDSLTSVCHQCRGNRFSLSLSIDWAISLHNVICEHQNNGVSPSSHRARKIIKKRRRKKSDFAWKPGDP